MQSCLFHLEAVVYQPQPEKIAPPFGWLPSYATSQRVLYLLPGRRTAKEYGPSYSGDSNHRAATASTFLTIWEYEKPRPGFSPVMSTDAESPNPPLVHLFVSDSGFFTPCLSTNNRRVVRKYRGVTYQESACTSSLPPRG